MFFKGNIYRHSFNIHAKRGGHADDKKIAWKAGK